MSSVLRRIGVPLAALANWRFFKPAVFAGCAIPLALVSYRFWLLFTGRDPDALGVEPAKAMLHETGRDALAILLITLSITPLRRIFSVNRLQSVRRMLGVWAFAYAFLHLSIYLVFDQLCYSVSTCQFTAIWQDILKRRFIFVGQFAFLCLLLLAITSTNGWMRRLKKDWKRLHRLVYVAAIAGIVHFVWIQKSDYSEALRWAAWLLVLFAIRVFFAAKRLSPRTES